jgi:hypothetical protein
MTHHPCQGPRQVWIVQRMKDASRTRRINERRMRADRRRRPWFSIIYGSFNPRRRRPARRLDDPRFQPLDWHSAHLLAVSISILLFSATDAFLTGILLVRGADEINPIMGLFVYRSVAVFAALKMAMTGASIVVMVILARYRFMRLFRVEFVLYSVLIVYAWLIGYELSMLKAPIELPLL